jgi:hypothetical protein
MRKIRYALIALAVATVAMTSPAPSQARTAMDAGLMNACIGCPCFFMPCRCRYAYSNPGGEEFSWCGNKFSFSPSNCRFIWDCD